MTTGILITEENESSYDQTWDLNVQAFGRDAEANLVNILRESGFPYISLIALKDDLLLGHIFFTPVELTEYEHRLNIMGLGPMAVKPEYQKKGIGSMLIKAGLEECKKNGCHAVVVLGHPDYYPKFGFNPSAIYNIKCEYDVPSEAFMVLELTKGVLKGKSGIIKYNNAFNTV